MTVSEMCAMQVLAQTVIERSACHPVPAVTLAAAKEFSCEWSAFMSQTTAANEEQLTSEIQ